MTEIIDGWVIPKQGICNDACGRGVQYREERGGVVVKDFATRATTFSCLLPSVAECISEKNIPVEAVDKGEYIVYTRIEPRNKN